VTDSISEVSMRLLLMLAAGVSAASIASAQCPGTCTGGGGPAATDCFLAYGSAPGKVIACTDGDAACDTDGQIDGACTFGLTACTNVALGGCVATPLDGPAGVVAKGTGAEAFASAVAALSTSTAACTAPGLVKLTIAPSQVKLKPAKVTLRMTAVAGGKKDKDTLKLVCNPARPSLGANVQPIFTANCTYAGCHSGALPQSGMSLEEGASAASLSQKALASPRTLRVKPGSLKKSYLAKGLFGVGAVQMPDGCPNVIPPIERCLSDVEIYTVLAWIQAGALP
jgi:hypothetical protein